MEKIKANFSDRSTYAFSPYNFVSLPNENFMLNTEESTVIKNGLHGQYLQGRHHGVIKLTITTLTPTYTKAAIPIEHNDSDQYEFFHYKERTQPVLPGSSVRGMMRHLVETVTRSCLEISGIFQHPFYHRFVAIDKQNRNLNQNYLHALKSSDQLFVKAGYIQVKNGEWWLYPAKPISAGYNFVRVQQQDLRGVKSQRYSWSQPIYFQVPNATKPKSGDHRPVVDVPRTNAISLQPTGKEGWQEGRLVKTGDMSKKKHEYLFGVCDEEHPVKIDGEVWQSFQQDVLSRSSGQAYSPADALINEWSDIIRYEKEITDQKIPIFYVSSGRGVRFIGAAKMMRVPDAHTAKDAIPKHLRKEETSGEQLDVASALFGEVDKEHNIAVRGRLLFSDAVWVGEGDPFVSHDYLVPFPLNGPKPSAFQRYLQQKGQGLTTYSDASAQVRGRKFYWHKSWIDNKDIFATLLQGRTLSSVETALRPVKALQPFAGEIQFYNLSDLELGVLGWLLRLDPNKYAFHIGMGKPLGMGSIRVSSEIILEDRKQRYRRMFDSDQMATGRIDEEQVTKIIDQCIAVYMQTIAPAGDFEKLEDIQDLLSMLEFDNQLDHEKIAYYKIGKEQKTVSELDANSKNSENYQWLEGYRSQWTEKTRLGTIRQITSSSGKPASSSQGQTKSSVTHRSESRTIGGVDKKVPAISANQKIIKRGDNYSAVIVSQLGPSKYKVKMGEIGQESQGMWSGRKLEINEVVKVKVLEVVNHMVKNVRIETK